MRLQFHEQSEMKQPSRTVPERSEGIRIRLSLRLRDVILSEAKNLRYRFRLKARVKRIGVLSWL